MSEKIKYIPFVHIPKQYSLPTGDQGLPIKEIIERGAKALYKKNYEQAKKNPENIILPWKIAPKTVKEAFRELSRAFVEEFLK
ncbi:hypothetical protein AAIR98_000856 [Elusimicrobium simillimum]|uniref:hypothetical protein n=1 Tax=Elusimicrobium simillimum TaxID=3143438 RepID=UPI003C6F3437